MRTRTRIDRRFADLAARGKKGFIAYVTACDPALGDTADAVLRLEQAGVDVVELGIPFSDPLADGRVNQDASTRALTAGARFRDVLEVAGRIRRHSNIPLLFFSYLNPLLAGGFGNTVRRAASVGVDGFLILDLPVEESSSYVQSLERERLNHVCLVTPTSPAERIRTIVRSAGGFVYCVSREGVTGMQKSLSSAALELVRRTKKYTRLPVALGFGISTPAQAASAARAADGVVVGSAIVARFAQEGPTAAGRARAARWVGRLVRAVQEV